MFASVSISILLHCRPGCGLGQPQKGFMGSALGVSDSVDSTRLFVGNLAYSVTREELQELFSQYGEIVDVVVVTDRFSGRPKGLAFVEYNTVAAAKAAVEALHEQELSGRNMIVAFAKPKADNGMRRGGGGHFEDRRGDRGGYGRGGQGGGRHQGRDNNGKGGGSFWRY
jgi:RNA recognition motif-containing protein